MLGYMSVLSGKTKPEKTLTNETMELLCMETWGT